MSLPLKSSVGSSGAPAMRTWASACTIWAIATAMSKLAVAACSMSEVSSGDWKLRHQSSAGFAASEVLCASR